MVATNVVSSVNSDAATVTVNPALPIQQGDKISAGGSHTVAIMPDGRLWAWGLNEYGQLGDGTTTNRNTPTQEATKATDWVAVSAGNIHTVALKWDGSLWAWGYGYGNSPAQVGTEQDWTAVSAGSNHTVALKKDGSIWAWGGNFWGQLGDGTNTDRNAPVQEATRTTDWTAVSASGSHTVALKKDGSIWAWGENFWGQLGDGTNTDRNAPVQEATRTTVWTAVSAGSNHTVALKKDGSIWAWGRNYSGQLGIGSNTNRNTPVQEATRATDWAAVAACDEYTVALKKDGTLWAWGLNGFGQLGDGTYTNRNIPVQEATKATDWATVSAGLFKHTVAIKKDGSIWAWGYNGYGQLGDGTTTYRNVPVQEATKATDWAAVAAGGGHTVALKNDGTQIGSAHD
jgi:alpha-tubulin suppressor-like RCC1 family protein